eukprot:c2571_g1_i2.p1 GENE.c2571_g1_i2~~c2571_g1_i2.p1  ORF type:complete len:601 (+),score=139.20 c2571_g1_i2:82-1803(+)
MCNESGPVASRDIGAHQSILSEPALFCTQLLASRTMFLACDFCHAPLGCLALHLALTQEFISRGEIVKALAKHPNGLSGTKMLEVFADGLPEETSFATSATAPHLVDLLVPSSSKGSSDLYCSVECRDKDRKTGKDLIVYCSDKNAPGHEAAIKFYQHALQSGHYDTIYAAALLVARCLRGWRGIGPLGGSMASKPSRGDEKRVAQDVKTALERLANMRTPRTKDWVSMVVNSEEPNAPAENNQYSVKITKTSRGFGVGIDAETLTVTSVLEGSSAKTAGIMVGDQVVAVGGLAVNRMYEESEDEGDECSNALADVLARTGDKAVETSESLIGLKFPSEWLDIEWTLERSSAEALPSQRVASVEDLKRTASESHQLLTNLYLQRSCGLSQSSLADAFSLQAFEDILAMLEQMSWLVNPSQVDPTAQDPIPSPCLAYASSLCDGNPSPDAVRIASVALLGHPDGTPTDIREAAGVLPAFSGRALFSILSTLPAAGSEAANCTVQLALGEGGVVAELIATRDVTAGDGLMLEVSEEPPVNEAGEAGGEGDGHITGQKRPREESGEEGDAPEQKRR